MIQIDVKKIIMERANQGLTIRALGKKSGVPISSISKMEHGSKVRLDTVGKLAKALGKKVEDFIIQ